MRSDANHAYLASVIARDACEKKKTKTKKRYYSRGRIHLADCVSPRAACRRPRLAGAPGSIALLSASADKSPMTARTTPAASRNPVLALVA